MAKRNRRRAAGKVLASALAVMILSGCEARRMLLNASDLDDGLVIVLPGIDGRAGHNESICRILCEKQVGMAVELYDWTAPLGPLFNQCAQASNRKAAAKLARRILDYGREFPGQPVFLIAHSGGTAIAAWAAEALPQDQKISGIIMLASSLSPGYELSQALAHTRHGIVSFYSHLDIALLGAGTSLVGTMDGKHAEAAGKVGFRRLGRANQADVHRKLFQVAWDREMARTGHDGGHFGCTAPGFVAKYVVAYIETTPWNRSLLARIAGRTGTEIAFASETTTSE